MLTFTGKTVNVGGLRPADIDIIDIAHGLSMTCRYGGHVTRFYSVAEHSVHMSRWVPPEHALQALLHDASEAYLGDVIKPLKDLLPDYMEIEWHAERTIAGVFGLPLELAPIVREADRRIVADERALLCPHAGPSTTGREPLGVEIGAWRQPCAELIFLQRFRELTR